jgi:phenylacetate-CoA oxygenase PaaI subunit
VTQGAVAALPRDAVRDLILVLADSKRLLGTRYAGWILGAPELEAGIACASMAQDEWGHGRLLYALLREFGDDVARIEHGREPAEYASMDALDDAPAEWPGLVALNVLADGALSTQLEALRESSHAPLRQRVEKLLDEERFHAAHGAAWFRRLAHGGDATRAALAAAVRRVLSSVLAWFGPDSDHVRALVDAAVADAAGSALRSRFLDRIGPLLQEIGMTAGDVGAASFAGFDEARRRSGAAGPDAAVIAQVRGDRNRIFLMD